MRISRRIVSVFIIAVLVFAMSSCGSSDSTNKSEKKENEKPKSVEYTYTLEDGNIRNTLELKVNDDVVEQYKYITYTDTADYDEAQVNELLQSVESKEETYNDISGTNFYWGPEDKDDPQCKTFVEVLEVKCNPDTLEAVSFSGLTGFPVNGETGSIIYEEIDQYLYDNYWVLSE